MGPAAILSSAIDMAPALRHGSSKRWRHALRRFGYSVRRNKPYAGGFITEHYGVPAAARYGVQIEINRALYMDERAMAKSERWSEVSEELFAMASQLASRIAREIRRPQIAAE